MNRLKQQWVLSTIIGFCVLLIGLIVGYFVRGMLPNGITVTVTDFIQALSGLIAAVVAIGIAGWQGHLQKVQLKHDLFSKRIDVYQAVVDTIDSAVHPYLGGHGLPFDFDKRAHIARLIQLSGQSRFLFPDHVRSFVAEVTVNAQTLVFGESKPGTQAREFAESMDIKSIQAWFEEARERALVLFSPYLDLSQL